MKMKQRKNEDLCIQQLAFVGYNNSTNEEKIQAFFRKNLLNESKNYTFGTTHKSRGTFNSNLTKQRRHKFS